mgnify:CR=1 FL=1
MPQCAICLNDAATGVCGHHHEYIQSELSLVNRLVNNAIMRRHWPSKAAIDAYAEAMKSEAITVDES